MKNSVFNSRQLPIYYAADNLNSEVEMFRCYLDTQLDGKGKKKKIQNLVQCKQQ